MNPHTPQPKQKKPIGVYALMVVLSAIGIMYLMAAAAYQPSSSFEGYTEPDHRFQEFIIGIVMLVLGVGLVTFKNLFRILTMIILGLFTLIVAVGAIIALATKDLGMGAPIIMVLVPCMVIVTTTIIMYLNRQHIKNCFS